ncbi:MAG: protein kinase domain-containing protein [Blastocatellia bacterium]
MANIISHYLITKKLGEGGMGEVYKAQDTTLDRPVALKILPEHLVEDPDRVRRFIQEAKSASALNHPNIVTIYEIGQVDAQSAPSPGGDGKTVESDTNLNLSGRTVHYIAMEFVDGKTLTAKIHGDREDFKKLLEYLAQVSEGLAKAHSAGIVHRDLKPDNIMVTQDGFAKILDFGLAKLVESSEQKSDRQQSNELEEAATAMMDKTRPGMVMGTVGYMSPEQVQGKPVDQRSDIFSFGCILYEAVTRSRPFSGDSVIDSLHKIVYSQPAPVREVNPGAPTEVQRIIRKCLAKDPAERYQSTKDTAIDLRELIKEYDSLATPSGPYSQPGVTGPSSQAPLTAGVGAGIPTGAGSSTYAGPQTGPFSGPVTGNGPASHITAPQEALPSGPVSGITGTVPRRTASKRIVITMATVFALLIIIGLVYVETTQKRHRSSSKNPFQNRSVAKLTGSGKSIIAAISPDGKYMAHVVADGGQQGLWLRQVATSTNIQLVPAADVSYTGVAFSKDGNYICYVTLQKGKTKANLFQIPVLGGDARRILEDIDSGVSFSPDSKRIAFIRNVPDANDSILFTARTDGNDEQKVATRKLPGGFVLAAWSPDGNTIACFVLSLVGGYHAELVTVPAGGGAEKPLGSSRWATVGSLDWLSDGSGLVIAALSRRGAQAPQQLWRVSYPDGGLHQITSDLNNYSGVSLTADSSALATVQAEVTSNLWIAPGGDMSRATQLTSGSGQNVGPAFTPDGKIVYESTASGVDLWIMDSDGKNKKQLTSGAGLNVFPTVSPDGRYIAFCSNRAGSNDAFNIYRIDIDGGGVKQLTSGEGEYLPVFSADGKWLYYTPLHSSNRPSIWKVSIDGGEPVQVINSLTMFAALSPDGKSLLCRYSDGKPNSGLKVAAFPVDGGAPTKVFDIDLIGIQGGRYGWSPDGKSITYIDTKNGSSNIWRQPLSGGPPQQVTNIKSEQLFDFAWSKKGDLALSRGNTTTDVVLIKESKQGDAQP